MTWLWLETIHIENSEPEPISVGIKAYTRWCRTKICRRTTIPGRFLVADPDECVPLQCSTFSLSGFSYREKKLHLIVSKTVDRFR